MNINAKRGDKVVFSHPNAGTSIHQAIAREHLAEGQAYTVERTEVEFSHTDVFLHEFPDTFFNSVLFSDAD